MRKRYSKLKFSVLLYFLIFTSIIICCLWIFQMAFFEGYYQSEKFKSMREYGQLLKSAEAGSSEFLEAEKDCGELGINVYIATVKGDKIVVNYPENYHAINDFDEYEAETIKYAIDDYMNSNNEGVAIGIVPRKDMLGTFYFSALNENNEFVVLTSSHAKLVETIGVIRLQFIYSTVIAVVIGIILAWFLSVRVSKPIDDMSVMAKKWAEGDNTVVFDENCHYAEINELAETLNYAKESVSKAGVLQRDLLANVSHDLKTPLTMIKAYAEMIRDISGENKEKRDKHTKVIMDEADRLTMLVNDILNLSKIQASVDALEMKEINLSQLTERVIDRFAPYVENQGFTIENHVAPDLLTVVDEQKIEQVVYNLLGNSLNYTGDDKVVKVYLAAENDKIILEIIDSGKGISQEKIATIWERYYRFSETNTRPVKGTGLGLSIVKTILDAHNLRFGVRSKKDCGSNFYVEFNRVKNE